MRRDWPGCTAYKGGQLRLATALLAQRLRWSGWVETGCWSPKTDREGREAGHSSLKGHKRRDCSPGSAKKRSKTTAGAWRTQQLPCCAIWSVQRSLNWYDSAMVTPKIMTRAAAVTTEMAITVRVMTRLSPGKVVGRGAVPTTLFASTPHWGASACSSLQGTV